MAFIHQGDKVLCDKKVAKIIGFVFQNEPNFKRFNRARTTTTGPVALQ